MAEKMSVMVRVYDQQAEDPGKFIDICSHYDDVGSNNLIELCVEDDVYILDTEQLKRAIDNAVNVWVPSKEPYYRHCF